MSSSLSSVLMISASPASPASGDGKERLGSTKYQPLLLVLVWACVCVHVCDCACACVHVCALDADEK